MVQAGIAPLNSCTVSRVPAIITPSTPQQAPSISLQSDISISVASGIKASHPFFNKDVHPVLYQGPLPSPDEPLQTTDQLAYCLELLEDSIQEDGLSPDAIQWRQRTLKSSDEQVRLQTMAVQIVETFKKDVKKDAAAVAEIVQLAPVLDTDHFRFLLTTFIDTVNQSEILHLHSLKGLAMIIQGAPEGSIDSDDLVKIVQSLHKKLLSTHSQSIRNRYHLLFAVSRVLDAMGDAGIMDVDRVNIHGPLTDFLRESESAEDPYLTFQSEYATQALLNVSDDDNIWRAGIRRGVLILKGSAGFAKMPDLTEIQDALEALEKLYEIGKESARLFKDILEAFKNHESLTFTVKDGLKFKRAWYRALRTAESYITTGKLMRFRDFIGTAPCRHQLMFQWGVCQLLGQIAVDTHWD